MDRRNFLGTGLAAAATVAAGNVAAGNLLPETVQKPAGDLPFNPRTFQAMPTRSFGKTGYKTGIFSLGGQATIEIAGREEESEKIGKKIDELTKYLCSKYRTLEHESTKDILKTFIKGIILPVF